MVASPQDQLLLSVLLSGAAIFCDLGRLPSQPEPLIRSSRATQGFAHTKSQSAAERQIPLSTTEVDLGRTGIFFGKYG